MNQDAAKRTLLENKLYFGDNLAILREQVPSESVDLVYLDPPFNSNVTYNVLFGEKSAAQISVFEDTIRCSCLRMGWSGLGARFIPP